MTGEPPASRGAGVERLYWLLKGFRDPAQAAFGVIVSVLATLWTTYGTTAMFGFPALWWALAAAAVAAIWGIGLLTFLRPTYRVLARQMAAATSDLHSVRQGLQNALDTLLRRELDELKLLTDTRSRISAYSVEHDEFILLSRHSANPTLERRGRPSYPLDQGVIGRAWRDRSAVYDDDSPTREEWERRLVEDDGFVPEDAARLTMFARSICAVRVDSAVGDKVGVIVVESESRAAFSASTVEKLRRSHICGALTDVLAASHSLFPRAKERDDERQNRHRRAPLLDEPVWKSAR